MRNTALLCASIALTILCWGLYGQVLLKGQLKMAESFAARLQKGAPEASAPVAPAQPANGATAIVVAPPVHPAFLRPFVCVGLAYFLIGVIVPAVWLHLYGEKGDWTLSGLAWSLAGGALGALGAFGIILAFKFGGRPIYVMPLVFGGAPVVNAFLTIYLAGRVKEIGPLFLAGLIMVALGAVTVLLSAPSPPASAAIEPWTSWVARVLAIALAIVSWGAYGPVLHKGQAKMHHSRLRPLLCVGLAYFLIAVITPYFFLGELGEDSTYASVGTLWSLAGGICGAVGAIGMIMAFNSGGKPVYVMPLVFGAAPVVNTLAKGGFENIGGLFLAGLILVITGSVMVLVFAPRGEIVAPAAVPT
jgi:hypothetical protein